MIMEAGALKLPMGLFTKYAVERVSVAFMATGSEIRIILRILSQYFERLQY
jgi:hypothetical protein